MNSNEYRYDEIEPEGVLMEYYAYKQAQKERRAMQSDTAYRPGQGWPSYRHTESMQVKGGLYANELMFPDPLSEDDAVPMRYTIPTESYMPGAPAWEKSAPAQYNPYNPAYNREDMSPSPKDLASMHKLYGEISQKIIPAINETLDEYEYEGSLIYDDQMNQETLAQIVDKVLDRAKVQIEEVRSVSMDVEQQQCWGRFGLLRSLIESFLLKGIFYERRPRRRYMRRGIPGIPGMLGTPGMPGMPEMPGMRGTPGMPEMPGMPRIPW